jgi:AsmA-like C-terminal region/Protein of unknown function
VIKPTAKFLLEGLGTLLLVLVVGFALLAWRLSSGPISLSFLTPRIAEALHLGAEDGYRVEVADTVLTWGGWDRTLDIRATGTAVFDSANSEVISVPEISLGISGPALLRGMIAPTSLEIISPRFKLIRHQDGTIGIDAQQTEDDPAAAEALRKFLAVVAEGLDGPPDKSKTSGYLSRISITDADVAIVDEPTGTSWRVPALHLDVVRDNIGLSGNASGHVVAGLDEWPVDAMATYGTDRGGIVLQFRFTRVEPAKLAMLSPSFATLAGIKFPVSGTVRAEFKEFGAVPVFTVDLSGGEGVLDLPDTFEQPLPVSQASFKGSYEQDAGRVNIDNAFFESGKTTFEGDGTIEFVGDDLGIKLFGTVLSLPLDDLRKFWPAGLSPGTRNWVVDNIRDGMVDDAQVLISIDPGMRDAGPLPAEAVDVAFNYHDMTAQYMSTMPPIVHGDGHAKLTARTLDVYMDTGDMAEDLMLRDGVLHITGIGIRGAAAADVETVVDGPAVTLLKVLDNEPLGYPTKFGIPPTAVTGRASTRAKFQFPLGARLALNRVRFSAASNLENITVTGIFGNASMTDGKLQLLVNTSGLEALGNVTMFGVPLDMTWTDNFNAPKGGPSSKYVFTGILDERQRRDLFPLVADYITGPVPLDIELMNSGPGAADGKGTFDLRDAVVDMPMLSWSKARDEPGIVNFAFTVSDKGLDVKSFDARGGGLTANGHLTYTGVDMPGEFDVERVSVGKTDVSARVTRDDEGGYAIAIKGASFDAGPLIDSTLTASKDQDDLPNLTFTGTIDRLIALNGVIVHNVSATVTHRVTLWRDASIHGDLDNGKTLDVAITPDGDHRNVSITSDDAGTVIRALDMYNNAVGGNLKLSAVIDDSKAENPMKGLLAVDNFSVIKAPGLAKVLTIGSLTGISNRLRREGLSFKRLEAPFQFHSRILRLGESRAVGPAIGFTLEGVVDQNRDIVDLKGTIVPAYTINKFLANMPLIGTILAGGDSEGIFAFTYDVKGTVSEPQVNVNALSGLAPGLLRKIVSGDSSDRFDREAAGNAAKADPPKSDTPPADQGNPSD